MAAGGDGRWGKLPTASPVGKISLPLFPRMRYDSGRERLLGVLCPEWRRFFFGALQARFCFFVFGLVIFDNVFSFPQ
jgi:hypothetical protein